MDRIVGENESRKMEKRNYADNQYAANVCLFCVGHWAEPTKNSTIALGGLEIGKLGKNTLAP